MPEKVELNLGTDQAAHALEALEAQAARLEQRLKSIATTLGTNPSAQAGAQFFQTAQELSTVKGAIGAIQGSATVTGPSVAAGAAQGASAFAKQVVMRSVADPQAIMNTLQGAGVGQQGIAAASLYLANGQIPVASGSQFNPTAYVQSIVAPSAQSTLVNNYISNWTANANAAQANASRMQQQIAIGRAAAGYGALSALGGGLSLYAANTAAGTIDPMGAANLYGGIGGGVLGALAGAATAPPYMEGLGFSLGMTAGTQIGGPLAQALMAPYMQTRNSVMTLSGIAARASLNPYTMLGVSNTPLNPLERMSGIIGSMRKGKQPDLATSIGGLAENISFHGKTGMEQALIQMGLYTGTDIISAPQLAQTISTVGSAFLAGGMPIGGAQRPGDFRSVAENLARRYYMQAPQMAQMAAPVIAAQNRYTRFDRNSPMNGMRPGAMANQADLMMDFGPEAYGAFADAVNGSQMTPGQISAYGNVQRADYSARLAGTQARGSGMAMASAYRYGMDQIAGLPGGTDSLAYGEMRQRYRGALMTGYRQQDIVGFDIPMTRAQGMLDRMNLLPFNPGATMTASLFMGGMANRQAGILEQRIETMRRAGNLSEEDELRLTSQAEQYRTMGASAIANVNEGFLNRLPAMSAGRPAFFGRYNSMQLAAAAVQGTPVRAFGALNGRQLRDQDDFYTSVGGVPAPWSRTQSFNNGGGGSAEIAGLLRELISAVRRNGGGMRAGEAQGSAFAAMYGKRVGNEGGEYN